MINNSINPYKDPDFVEALADLDKEFPGVNIRDELEEIEYDKLVHGRQRRTLLYQILSPVLNLFRKISCAVCLLYLPNIIFASCGSIFGPRLQIFANIYFIITTVVLFTISFFMICLKSWD